MDLEPVKPFDPSKRTYWSREHIAEESGVSVRTVDRASRQYLIFPVRFPDNKHRLFFTAGQAATLVKKLK